MHQTWTTEVYNNKFHYLMRTANTFHMNKKNVNGNIVLLQTIGNVVACMLKLHPLICVLQEQLLYISKAVFKWLLFNNRLQEK